MGAGVSARNGYFYIFANSVGYNFSSYFNAASLSEKLQAIKTGTFTLTDETYVGGIADATGKSSGLPDGGNSYLLSSLQTIKKSGQTNGPFQVYWGPEGTTAGNFYYTAQFLITQLNPSGKYDDVVKVDVDYQRSGGTTTGTF